MKKYLYSWATKTGGYHIAETDSKTKKVIPPEDICLTLSRISMLEDIVKTGLAAIDESDRAAKQNLCSDFERRARMYFRHPRFGSTEIPQQADETP